MTSILNSNSEALPVVLLFLISATVALGIIVTIQGLRLRHLRRTWNHWLSEADGTSLERALQAHMKERAELRDQFQALENRLGNAERKVGSAVRYLGMVRYDAFDDVGAAQSWSLAFYDEKGDGAVLTCLYGRTDCRVYSKVLDGGKSDRSLTGEEQAAIEAAARSTRTVVRS